MLKTETATQQSLLANYCRTGVKPELIGIKEENLYQYRRLVFNIALDTLETAYPITYRFLNSEQWEDLIQRFFAEHKCSTTQVWRMPLEFYQYCKEKNIGEQLQFPFLNDLLFFEWLELEVHTMDDIPYPPYQELGSWLHDQIATNPEHKLVVFEYPVHTTAPTDKLEEKKGNYYFLIYREKETGNVHFLDLSMLHVFILENINEGNCLETILVEANKLFQLNDLELLKKHALTFMEDLKHRQFILGFKN